MIERILGRTLLLLAALHLGWPAPAVATSVVVYPPDGARPREELAELASMIEAAMLRIASRGSEWTARSGATRPRCGGAASASPPCLARMAGDGVVLLAVAGAGDRTTVDLRAVDDAARTLGPVRVHVDFVIQNIEGLAAGILRLEDLHKTAKRAVVAQAARPGGGASMEPEVTSPPVAPSAVPPGPSVAPPAPRAAPPDPSPPSPVSAPASRPDAAGPAPAITHPEPARGPMPREPGTSPAPETAPTPPGGRPFALVLAMGIDRGSTDLVTVEFTDGSTETLRANEGFYFAAGAAFLLAPVGRATFDTLATVGVKGWEVGADNGKISYLAFPLEVLERFAIDSVRLGLGVSWLLAPRLKSSGALADFGDPELKNSLGIVTQLEWIGRRAGRAGVFLGGRFVVQKLEAKGGTGTIGANTFGLLLGFEL